MAIGTTGVRRLADDELLHAHFRYADPEDRIAELNCKQLVHTPFSGLLAMNINRNSIALGFALLVSIILLIKWSESEGYVSVSDVPGCYSYRLVRFTVSPEHIIIDGKGFYYSSDRDNLGTKIMPSRRIVWAEDRLMVQPGTPLAFRVHGKSGISLGVWAPAQNSEAIFSRTACE